jgi:GT2 family glycosyltransferase
VTGATLVADLETTAVVRDLELPAGVSEVVALLRRRGRPVGLVRLHGAMRISAATLQQAFALHTDAVDDAPPRAAPISIVVCTRDRPDDLARCLAALQVHAHAGHEVIVVDNAPSDDRAQRLAAAFPCRYVGERRPGLDRARNRGLREARHAIVAFTDDDCAPDAGWVDALVAPLAEASVVITTGLVMPLELETEGQRQFEAYCANRRRFQPRVFRRADTPPSTAGVVGMGANMSCRRDALLALGGFDERFDGGMPTLSGGETDAFARVIAAGHAIAYRPDALVWHRHRRGTDEVRRCIFGYGVGVFAFLAKRLAEDGDTRVFVTATRWLLGPPLKAVWNRLRRRPATPASLVWMELWGALHGPRRYRAACRVVAREDAVNAC